MLKIDTTYQWHVEAKCDACNGEPVRVGNCRAEYDALASLRRDGWLFFVVDVEHWRLKIAVCPDCAVSLQWLCKIIDEHNPEARRLRS